LGSGKHLLLTPGAYSLNGTIQVNNPHTIVLGLGIAALVEQPRARREVRRKRVFRIVKQKRTGSYPRSGPFLYSL